MSFEENVESETMLRERHRNIVCPELDFPTSTSFLDEDSTFSDTNFAPPSTPEEDSLLEDDVRIPSILASRVLFDLTTYIG